MTCYLNVTSITQSLFSGYIEKIYITGYKGALNIYPGHAPFLTVIKPGLLHIFEKSEEKKLYVSTGVLEVQPKVIYVLPDDAYFLNNLNYDQFIKQSNHIKKKISLQKNSEKKYHLEQQLRVIIKKINFIEKYQ